MSRESEQKHSHAMNLFLPPLIINYPQFNYLIMSKGLYLIFAI